MDIHGSSRPEVSIRQIAAALALIVSLLAMPTASAQQAPRVAQLGSCQLSNGAGIAGCRVAYRTYGRLNASRDNAVLIPTWLQGRSEDWLSLLGPEGYVDTTQYYVIVVDALGDGHSSSPSNVPARARSAFRNLTISAMVESQHRLLTEHLKIAHLHAVVGFSMGGMQALEWAVRYPTFMDRAVPLAGAPRLGAFDHLMWTTTLQEIENGLRSGMPADSVWAQLARQEALLVQTPAAVNQLTWDSVTTAAAAQAKSYSKSWSLEDFAAQLHAIRRHDISLKFGGDMTRAAKAIRARVFIVHSPDDHMVTAGPAIEFANMIGAQTLLLPSDCGHLALFCQLDTLSAAVRAFLARDNEVQATRDPPEGPVRRQLDPDNRGAVIPPDGGDSVFVGSARRPTLIKVDPSTTGSRQLFVFELVIEPGDSLPVHRHHQDDEVFFIHSGEVVARVGQRERPAAAGSTVYIPAGVAIGMVNRGRAPAKSVIVFGAPHMAQYIRSLGSLPGEPPRKLSPAELDKIRRRHHITFP